MFYNQFNNSNLCDFDNRKDKENNKVKGYCTVKVIQECCYPSYFDYEEKNKLDECNHDNRDCQENNYNKNDYDWKSYDMKDDYKHEKCCCKKEDRWEDKNSCNCNHKEKEEKENKCCKQKRCCGFCSCFRRW